MYGELKAKFERQYGRAAEYIFSAPGRTELGGNHTDHQHGLVLAAAVTLDTKAAAAENNDGCIRVISEGYAPVTVRLDELEKHPEERNTTAAASGSHRAAMPRSPAETLCPSAAGFPRA